MAMLHLAMTEFRLFLKSWPMRVALLLFFLLPLFGAAQHAARPEFQAHALRESFGALALYGFPLLAIALGSASLQSGMISSILVAPLSRRAFLGARLLSRATLLALAIGLSISSAMIGGSYLEGSIATSRAEIRDVTHVAKHDGEKAPTVVTLAGGEDASILLRFDFEGAGQFRGIRVPMVKDLKGQSERSKNPLELEIVGEGTRLVAAESTIESASFTLPEEGNFDESLTIRLTNTSQEGTITFNIKTIEFFRGASSPFGSFLLIGLRAFLIALVFMALAALASARFSHASALTITAALFFLTFFVSAIPFGGSNSLAKIENPIFGSETPRDRAQPFDPAALLPQTSLHQDQERFERDGIAISEPNLLALSLASWIYFALGLMIALLLLRDRDFLESENDFGA